MIIRTRCHFHGIPRYAYEGLPNAPHPPTPFRHSVWEGGVSHDEIEMDKENRGVCEAVSPFPMGKGAGGGRCFAPRYSSNVERSPVGCPNSTALM